MIEILKRVHKADIDNDILNEDFDENNSDDEDCVLDSDDEQEVMKLMA